MFSSWLITASCILQLAEAVSITVDCAQSGNPGTNAIDFNNNTIWHSQYDPAVALPHRATLDLGTATWIKGFKYLPRQDVKPGGFINGNIGQHDVQVSTDNAQWTTVVSKGVFADTAILKTDTFPEVLARYVRMVAYTEAGNRGPWTSAAEFGVVLKSDAPVAGAPSRGSWGAVINLPIVATGAFLVPGSGKVIVFSASGRTNFDAKGNTYTAIFDPATGGVTERNVRETGHDMFCPGLSLDFEGRAVVTGGNDNFPTSIYTPSSDAWTKAANMQIKRGYQSSTTLSDGRTFLIGGSWTPVEERGGKNGEIYNPTTNTWTKLAGCPVAPMLTNDQDGIFRADNHAWLFAWKDGSVFQAGPSKAMNWYGTSGTGSQSSAGLRASDGDSMCGNAVMYDAVNGKIFTVGGSPSYERSQATTNAHLITIGAPGSTPTVARLTSMTYARAFANSVVLPDGKVFVTGGQSYAVPFSDDQAVLQPELWDPATQKFTILPSHRVPRTYHSIAILLLDGRVFTGGGGLCGSCSTNHFDAEIYSPGYLFDTNGAAAVRPIIQSVSASSAPLGSSVTVTTGSAVTSFSLIRYGSTTHTVDTDQRRIPLDAVAVSGTTYRVTIPGNAGVALPGYWMLFAINSAGVPSVAKTIKITPS